MEALRDVLEPPAVASRSDKMTPLDIVRRVFLDFGCVFGAIFGLNLRPSLKVETLKTGLVTCLKMCLGVFSKKV